jgi:hypothetical protein
VICLCGCTETTKGGQFLPGHDARYKSHLIREALADNPDALAELERRGWLRFLEKTRTTRELATASPSERKAHRSQIARPERFRDVDSIRLLNLMKAADRVLRQIPKELRPELRPEQFHDRQKKRAVASQAYCDYLEDIINLSLETPAGKLSTILVSETPITQGAPT